MAKCTYCKGELTDGRAVEVCDSCGVKVWGPKMFKAIMDNMKTEQEKGNMELGRVSEGAETGSPGSIQEMHRKLQDANSAKRR